MWLGEGNYIKNPHTKSCDIYSPHPRPPKNNNNNNNNNKHPDWPQRAAWQHPGVHSALPGKAASYLCHSVNTMHTSCNISNKVNQFATEHFIQTCTRKTKTQSKQWCYIVFASKKSQPAPHSLYIRQNSLSNNWSFTCSMCTSRHRVGKS